MNEKFYTLQFIYKNIVSYHTPNIAFYDELTSGVIIHIYSNRHCCATILCNFEKNNTTSISKYIIKYISIF